ncbi:MAG TPA: pitrilysin family protein [Bryobacteraceae bacterium]|jgi:zinc protease|nr:pitrilysin family protein [Bryobacteraceae bacterium]
MKTLLVLLAAGCLFGQAKLPPYTKETLPNGAVIAMMPRSGVPLVHFRVLIKGGVESDPADKAGLANVTAGLLRRGTKSRSAEQFAEELDFLGGTFQAAFDGPLGSATAISSEFLSKDFDKGLDLLSDAVLHPAFTESEVHKELARRIDGAKAIKDNAQGSIGSYFRASFFGRAHPYGNPPDERSYSRIASIDIREYHAKHYCGKNMLIVVTGDFDPSIAKAKLAQAFGGAPTVEAYTWKAVPPLARKGQLLLIDKPDATQTYFQIAQPGIDMKNPDRTTLEIINTLFGGRFTSMLNDELRVNSGLTYGAASQLEQNRLPGAILISTYTKTDTTTQAIDLALDVLRRLNEKGISAQQLASAKAYVKGTYPTRRLETMDQLAALIGEIELYGLGRDEVDGYFARIDNITLDQANAAIRKYYKTGDLTFVVLGAADKIREQMKKYDPHATEVSIKTTGWGN